MNPLAAALLGPLPQSREAHGPPLNKRGQPYIMYGNSQNNQVWFQNSRLYLPDGRMLSPEELASDSFSYVPVKLRQGVAALMTAPQPAAKPAPVVRDLTPEETVSSLDASLGVGQPRYREQQALGIIVRTPLEA